MKALILNNTVVDIAETEFETHESMLWIDCTADCKIGWILESGIMTEPTIEEPTYSQERQRAYPSLTEQADMAYWDRQNGTTTLDDAISAVKTTYPKPGV